MAEELNISAELEKLDKDVLVEIILSGKLPDNLKESAVGDYLQKGGKLKCVDVVDTCNSFELVEDPDALKRKLETALNENFHVKKIVQHLEKRVNEQEELISLMKEKSNKEAETRKEVQMLSKEKSLPKEEDREAPEQNFYWKNYIPDEIPHDAVKGVDGKYIGQVNYQENVLPVIIYPDTNIAIGERAGKRDFDENIKILCSPDPSKFYWERVDFENPSTDTMTNVVKGGYQDGYNLYIGKSHHHGEWKIGKVVPMENVLYKGLQVWGHYDECVIITKFRILKYKTSVATGDDAVMDGFYWREYVPNEIPYDAVEGADGKYIGQIGWDGDIPATIDPQKNAAIIEKNGKSIIIENIKILCSSDRSRFYWEHINLEGPIGDQMKGAVVGGYKDGHTLFIGRTYHEGDWKIGKVIATEDVGSIGLHVWDLNDKWMLVKKFELLKCKSQN